MLALAIDSAHVLHTPISCPPPHTITTSTNAHNKHVPPPHTQVSARMAGLALVHVLGLSGVLQWMVRQTSEAENTMTSVERMLEYTRLPQVCCECVLWVCCGCVVGVLWVCCKCVLGVLFLCCFCELCMCCYYCM